MLCVSHSWFVWFNKDQQQHSNLSSTKGAYTDIKKKRTTVLCQGCLRVFSFFSYRRLFNDKSALDFKRIFFLC